MKGGPPILTKPSTTSAVEGHPARHRASRAALGDEAEIQALRDCYASLTPREREIMTLVVSGLLNKQVRLKLGISEIT